MKQCYHSRRRSPIMKAILAVVGIVTLVAVLWATVRNALDPNLTSEDAPVRIPRKRGKWPVLDGELDRVFWMVQLSDIHISKFRDLKRGPDLVQFCKDYLTVIDPSLVLITGDLTDSKAKDDTTSRQFEGEWQRYHSSIEQCKAMAAATFLDVRGNHDAFDVPEIEGTNNHYRKYSVMGRKHSLSYHHLHSTPFGQYSFIAVDACPNPGSKRPFNFFGHLDDERVGQLLELKEASRNSNLTMWFGHYPSSMIVQDPPGIRHIMRDGVAYLCGHLHTLGDMVPRMYSRQKTGTLELELGDWKIDRMFRVLAVDHDLLSFTDAKLGDWPLILVTNPKDALFLAPHHEPIESIKYSTHIRVLVFSPKGVRKVAVFIDDVYFGEAEPAKGPLYTLPWQSSYYGPGLHKLMVHVQDDSGTVKYVEQHFSVDGSSPEFRFWPRFILMNDLFTFSKMMFGIITFGYVLTLASLRQCSTIRSLQISSMNYILRTWDIWIYRIWLVSRCGPIYYTLLGLILYMTFGPWFVGEFITGHTGVLFVWGIFVKGTFITGSLSYLYGVFQILTFNGPLTLILGATLDVRRQQVKSVHLTSNSQRWTSWRVLVSDLPFSLLLLFQTYVALTEFPKNYGTTALVLSPVRVGSVFAAIVLLYFAYSAPVKKTSAVNDCAGCQ